MEQAIFSGAIVGSTAPPVSAGSLEIQLLGAQTVEAGIPGADRAICGFTSPRPPRSPLKREKCWVVGGGQEIGPTSQNSRDSLPWGL